MRFGMLKATLTLMTVAVAACGGAAKAPEAASAPGGEYADASAEMPAAYGQPMAPGAEPSDAPAPAPMEEFAGDADGAPAVAVRRPGGAEGKSVASDRPASVAAASGVRAGEWNDNANYREFQKYLSTREGQGHDALDIRDRRFIVVRDANEKGVPNCQVQVTDSDQHQTTLTTTASGRALLFPHAEGMSGKQLTATTQCQGQRAAQRFTIDSGDGVVTLDLATQRALPARQVVDIAFVLDTTGSMSEEIAAVKSTIRQVAKTLEGQNFEVRIGLVEYRDKGDNFVTRVHQMSSDLNAFAQKIDSLSAGGGGDTPEHVNEGLKVAVSQLSWSDTSVARMAFLIGDAPPQLRYQDDVSYANTAKKANHQGIQIFTVAASGMDDVGQTVFRQVAQYTGGTNMFVLRGGAGPQSTGGGDPTSSCGGTHNNYSSGNLHALITRKITTELQALNGNPTRIAGLFQDENAKPCDKRLIVAGG